MTNKSYSASTVGPGKKPDSASGSSMSGSDWVSIISGLTQGAQTAMGSTDSSSSKKDAKERKRRTLANILNAALQRKHNLDSHHAANEGESTDMKAQMLQQQARGFIKAFKGKSKR